MGDHAEPQYSVIPGIAGSEGGAAPAARTKHAACAVNDSIAILGGADEDGNLIDENPTLWFFDTKTSTWDSHLPANPTEAPPARSQGKLFAYRDTLILYGGFDAAGTPLQDTWTFALATKFWTSGPAAPVHTSSAALCDGVLYLISSPSPLSSDIHFLPVVPPLETAHEWSTVPFPTNPLTPGPAPRTGAELLPLRTGHGRLYLLYLFGAAPPPHDPAAVAAASPYHSDLWTYQLPSATPEAPNPTAIPTLSTLSAAVQPARIKDAIRGALGFESGSHSWAEVDVRAPSETDLNFADEGKVHPGPRGFAAADVMQDGKGVVLWGGVNAKGEREGDGWMIRLE
nr:tip elongation aberrant protein 3 [Quercus suber]